MENPCFEEFSCNLLSFIEMWNTSNFVTVAETELIFFNELSSVQLLSLDRVTFKSPKWSFVYGISRDESTFLDFHFSY